MTDRRLRLAMAALALLGLGVAGYLTYVHYAGITPVCAAGGGCETVQSSHWAKVGGVPVALIGVLGYVAVLASLALPGERGRLAGAALTLAGFGFSVYLTALELFEIHAICQWCVGSAAIMTLLAGLAVARLLRADIEPEPGPAASGRRSLEVARR
jgi:uncharacterized membrane protein